MRVFLPRREPLFGRTKSTKLSPASGDKELDLLAFMRMRAVARILPTSARRASGVICSEEIGLGRSRIDLQHWPGAVDRIKLEKPPGEPIRDIVPGEISGAEEGRK